MWPFHCRFEKWLGPKLGCPWQIYVYVCVGGVGVCVCVCVGCVCIAWLGSREKPLNCNLWISSTLDTSNSRYLLDLTAHPLI